MACAPDSLSVEERLRYAAQNRGPASEKALGIEVKRECSGSGGRVMTGARRNRQIVRELQLLLLLEQTRVGVTLRELASQLLVTERTIRRALAALEEAGVTLVDTQDDSGASRWRVFNWRKEVA